MSDDSGFALPYSKDEEPYAFAGYGQRVRAFLIDTGLYLVAILIAGLPPIFLVNVSETIALVYALLGYTAALGFMLRQLYVQGETGQTIGKAKVGIALVRYSDGKHLGGWLSVIRSMVLHGFDTAPCYLGMLWPLWDPKRQTFADKIVDTVVIVRPKQQ